MNRFSFSKFIITLLVNITLVYFLCLLQLRLYDALMICACITIVYSFTFIHTMLGQNAANRGNPTNQYQRIKYDMKYNIREDKGYIPEILLAGILELIVSLIITFIK